jgi:hypothetical protein
MLFLVEMTQLRAMPQNPIEHSALKAQVCESLEMLAHMAGLHGGVVAGGRSVLFMIEEERLEDLDSKLQQIPLWSSAEVTRVTPLVSFRARLAYNTAPEERTP